MTDIGSRRWWQITPLYGAMGIADHVLRLLEQEVISRRKASELLAWGEHVRLHADGCPPHCERLNDSPGAPWDMLNWCDDVCPGDPIVECSCPCCGAVLDVTHGDDEGEISVVGHMPPCAACEVEAASGSDYNRQHTCERDANRAPCPTCDGEGGWLEADSPNPSAEMQHSECPDCHGHGTLDARALQAMVLEFRAAADNGGYQAGIATAARFVADEMRDGMTPDSLSHQIMRLLVDPSEHMCPTDNFHPLLAECALYIDGALMGERRRTLRDRLTIALAPSAGREGGEHE